MKTTENKRISRLLKPDRTFPLQPLTATATPGALEAPKQRPRRSSRSMPGASFSTNAEQGVMLRMPPAKVPPCLPCPR